MEKIKYYYTVVGLLNAARYIQDIQDQPTIAANLLRDEVIEPGLYSIRKLKSIARFEDIDLKKVWNEGCLKSYK